MHLLFPQNLGLCFILKAVIDIPVRALGVEWLGQDLRQGMRRVDGKLRKRGAHQGQESGNRQR